MDTDEPNNLDLSCLDAQQIERINKALADIGEFGEVRLIKAHGKLRFIQKVDSIEIVSRQPGIAE